MRSASCRLWVTTTSILPPVAAIPAGVGRSGRPCAIEIARRLVRQEQEGPVDQGSGQCRPLAFTAGQLRGPVIEAVAQSDPIQQFLRPLDSLGKNGTGGDRRHASATAPPVPAAAHNNCQPPQQTPAPHSALPCRAKKDSRVPHISTLRCGIARISIRFFQINENEKAPTSRF